MRNAPAILALILLATTSAAAGTTRTWSVSSGDSLADGTLDGTAIDEQGRVGLAPPMDTWFGPDQGIVWDIAADGDDAAFVATSGPSRVLRVSKDGPPVVWYTSSAENLISAVEADGNGGVYIGFAPAGDVHHITAPGESSSLVATPSTFVWDLKLAEDGSLWIAAGLPGSVTRRKPDGKVERLYESGDDPVRTLLPRRGGGVWAGTGGEGRVVRIDERGRTFVLLDTEEAEIVGLVENEDGSIYALSASGMKQPARSSSTPAVPANATRVRVTADPPDSGNGDDDGNGDDSDDASSNRRPARPQPQTFRSSAGGKLYRIEADGTPRTVWQTTTDVPFGLARDASGSLLVATGERGFIWRIDEQGRAARLVRVASTHASSIVRTPGGDVLVGATSDARVTRIGSGPRSSGSYATEPVDAGHVADWGRVRWNATVPRGTKLTVSARAGNTDEPDATWTEWRTLEAESGIDGAVVDLPPARWFQVRFELTASKDGAPAVSAVQVFYRPRNRAPEIRSLEIEPYGVVLVQGPTPSSNQLGPLVADDPVARRAADVLGSRQARTAVRRGWEAGARTFRWAAEDPDGDRLSYSLDLRREDAEGWFPLATRLTESYYSWDARSLPDGLYRVRLVAVDTPDNPQGDDRRVEQVSDLFFIDNSRPTLEKLERSRDGAVSFVASDPGGIVAAVEVALEDGSWYPIDPLDGVADSPRERYQWTPPDSASGPLRLRVTDAAGNLGGQVWMMPGR